jgi:hypothetical protein
MILRKKTLELRKRALILLKYLGNLDIYLLSLESYARILAENSCLDLGSREIST